MRNDELVHEIAADLNDRFSRGKVEEDILQGWVKISKKDNESELLILPIKDSSFSFFSLFFE